MTTEIEYEPAVRLSGVAPKPTFKRSDALVVIAVTSLAVLAVASMGCAVLLMKAEPRTCSPVDYINV